MVSITINSSINQPIN